MIELEEHLKRLADSVELPTTTPADDLARGRTRRRRHNLGVLGAAATTAAVIGVSVVLLSGGPAREGAGPQFTGSAGPAPVQTQTDRPAGTQLPEKVSRSAAGHALGTLDQLRSPATKAVLAGYRDILREDLDPTGAHIQRGSITNEQGGSDSLGTKLTWNGGGMLQVAVGRSLEGVQFFCDGACTRQTVAGASKALVLSAPGKISVAVFQDDGDIVALTADTSFGNNGTSTHSAGADHRPAARGGGRPAPEPSGRSRRSAPRPGRHPVAQLALPGVLEDAAVALDHRPGRDVVGRRR